MDNRSEKNQQAKEKSRELSLFDFKFLIEVTKHFFCLYKCTTSVGVAAFFDLQFLR